MTRIVNISNIQEKLMIISVLETGIYPDKLSKDQKHNFKRKVQNFVLRNGSLCHRTREGIVKQVICNFESEAIKGILTIEHGTAHIGAKKLLTIVNQKYYGILQASVYSFVAECSICSRYNSLTTLQPVFINEITARLDLLMMDCVDLRKYSELNSGYSWILNVIDTFTKYLWSFKLEHKTANSVLECLKYIFENYGVPLAIQSDNGREFKNQVLRDYMLSKHIRIIHGKPRNPKAQGQIERANQTIKRWLSKGLYEINSKQWILIHSNVVKQYNLTVHRATGKSPFLLFHRNNGFNRPIENQEISEDTASSGDIEYQSWNLEEACPYDVEEPGNYDLLRTIDEKEASMHFNSYKESLIKNQNSNRKKSNISENDSVLIKQNFDTNPLTRKNSFDSFFEPDKYTVIKVLQNNMLCVKNNSSGEVKNVSSTKVKKLSGISNVVFQNAPLPPCHFLLLQLLSNKSGRRFALGLVLILVYIVFLRGKSSGNFWR
jgi:IS30 family transposase